MPEGMFSNAAVLGGVAETQDECRAESRNHAARNDYQDGQQRQKPDCWIEERFGQSSCLEHSLSISRLIQRQTLLDLFFLACGKERRRLNVVGQEHDYCDGDEDVESADADEHDPPTFER